MFLRNFYRLVAMSLLLGLFLFGTYHLYIYYQDKPEANEMLQTLSIAPERTRLLVIAPHCDDETLGCAGVIQEVIGTGGQVLVIVMTNGDGFTFAAKEQFHRLFLTSADYIHSGYARQSELLRAMYQLEIAENKVIFLGYPDRGLRALWTDYWDSSQPYQSRYTGKDHSPYSNSYHPNTPYAGEAVMADLEQVIADFKPNVILSSHPADEHPDHAATWAFLTTAVTRISSNDIMQRPKLYTYLIHRGDFPIPHGYRPEAMLLPPKPLQYSDHRDWQTYRLTAEQKVKKEQALKEYVSQLQVPIMSNLLRSFIRKNELFEEVVVPIAIAKSSEVDLAILETWTGQKPVLVQPKGVSALGLLERKAKVNDLACTIQGTSLWLYFHIPGFSEKRNQYEVSVVGFRIQPWQREKRTFYFSTTNTDLLVDNIKRFQDAVIVKIPYNEQDFPDYFLIQVLTKDRFGEQIGHTIWQPVYASDEIMQ
jgi:LmbE family N-acetylglucosaminyl deacetylase